MAFGLFEKGASGRDFNALQTILNQGADKQKLGINEAFAQTKPLTQQFATTQTALGKTFQTDANKRAQTFAQGLQNVENPEFVQDQQAKARQLAFRGLPGQLQQTREQLAASGGLGRGAAIRALQQPIFQAQQNASDAGFQIQQEARSRDIQRKTQAISTIFQTGQGAALTKLGIDENVARTLLENGRSDILDRAFKLAGIEEGRTQGLINIEQNRQSEKAAEEAAKRARTGQIISALGAGAGAGIGGAFGGPLGASIGSSAGGQLGGLAGGQGGGFDLSGALAMLALQQGNKTSTGIGRGRTTPNSKNFSSLFPGGK